MLANTKSEINITIYELNDTIMQIKLDENDTCFDLLKKLYNNYDLSEYNIQFVTKDAKILKTSDDSNKLFSKTENNLSLVKLPYKIKQIIIQDENKCYAILFNDGTMIYKIMNDIKIQKNVIKICCKNFEPFIVLKENGNIIFIGSTYIIDYYEVVYKLSRINHQKYDEVYLNTDYIDIFYGSNYEFYGINKKGQIYKNGQTKPYYNFISIDVDLQINTIKCWTVYDTCLFLKNDGLLLIENEDYGSLKIKINSEKQIFCNFLAFAILTNDNKVLTYGSGKHGGNSEYVNNDLCNVKHIYTLEKAFIAVKYDGSIVPWGHHRMCSGFNMVKHKLKSGVKEVYYNISGVSILKDDGSVVAWKNIECSWDIDFTSVEALLQKDVKYIVSSSIAFAALKEDGCVIVWGIMKDRDISSQKYKLLNNVIKLYSNDDAFIALKNDGSAVIWGNNIDESIYDSSEYIMPENMKKELINIVKVESSKSFFALTRNDNTAIIIGQINYMPIYTMISDSKKIYYTNLIIIVFRNDNSIVILKKNSDDNIIIDNIKTVVQYDEILCAVTLDDAYIIINYNGVINEDINKHINNPIDL